MQLLTVSSDAGKKKEVLEHSNDTDFFIKVHFEGKRLSEELRRRDINATGTFASLD